MSFSLFRKLPTEIQCQIWQECLPRRTIEVSLPEAQRDDFWNMLLSQHWDNHNCVPQGRAQMLRANHSKPVISRVCNQAHQISRIHSKLLQRDLPLQSATERYWVQPKADLLHLNQNQRCLAYTDTDGKQASPVDEFLKCADTLGVSVSLSHKILFNFGRPDLPASLTHNEAIADLQAVAQMGPQRLDVVLQYITLHVPRDVGVHSGLFGLFGEELLQSVDIWDTACIQRYRLLWEAHTVSKHLRAKEMFSLFENADQLKNRLEIWLDKVYFRLIAAMWVLARTENPSSISDVWHPPVEKGCKPSSATNKLNHDHPWVQSIISLFPKIQPRVMFRHCFSWQCDEKLPFTG